MKSKELKLLRKKLDKAHRIGRDVLEPLVRAANDPQQKEKDGVQPPAVTMQYTTATELLSNNNNNNNNKSKSLSSSTTLQECLDLFETNMADQYRQSSWGLQLDEKLHELSHKHARFVLLTANDNTTTTTNGDQENTQPGTTNNNNDSKKRMVGYCHFRFEYDDEDDPQTAVLYVYELQLQSEYQRQGWGKCLMQLMETMAQSVALPKVMLTVFQANTAAMQFYTQALKYQVDESSPSQHGVVHCDYEILSKVVV